MQMGGWTDHLHIDLFGEHVLFPSLRLDSAWHFVVASLFTTALCLIERLVAMTRRHSFAHRRVVYQVPHLRDKQELEPVQMHASYSTQPSYMEVVTILACYP